MSVPANRIELRYLAGRAPLGKKADLEAMYKEFWETGKIPRALEVMGIAVDDSLNSNNWRVLDADLDSIAEQLKGAQYRIDHSESARDIVGKVTDGWREGGKVFYKAKIYDKPLIEKILLDLVRYDSISLTSNDTYCDACYGRYEPVGQLESARYKDISRPHDCGQTAFVVANSKVIELSAVATPAYQAASFMPTQFTAGAKPTIGFKAAMDQYIMQCRGDSCSPIQVAAKVEQKRCGCGIKANGMKESEALIVQNTTAALLGIQHARLKARLDRI